MAPPPLRRYRAERLLRAEFDGRRGEVLAIVRAKLGASGVRLDASDLEDCYAEAWQGLYAELVEGRRVANPVGWLTVVTFRRAIDVHRARRRRAAAHAGGGEELDAAAEEPDFAVVMDDGATLRHLFEALRGRLDARECEAASLCYLQGLSREQAAARMGIGERAMRKLMDGRGARRPGVAAKFAELLAAVGGGTWCEQQDSLLRAFAFGVLDPEGERHGLALAHLRACPACRARVRALRGLATVLPPLALPWSPGVAGAGAGAGAGTGVGAAAGGGTGAGSGIGLGLGGAKLAVGCLLVLGAGCAALATLPHHRGAARAHVHRAAPATAQVRPSAGPRAAPAPLRTTRSGARRASVPARTAPASRVVRANAAQREFGPEGRAAPVAHTARASATHAEREFGP
jgi:DNA-directed RNA polymerase specialized sigma24 family protein